MFLHSMDSFIMKKILLVVLLAVTFTGAGAQEREIRMYAHRGGGKIESDENTLSAFKRSYDAGIKGYETDVRLSKDGVVVISHDNTFQRTCGDPRHVEDLTSDEIRKIRTKQGNPILFLQDLVEWYKEKGDVSYLEIEFKTALEGEYSDEKMKELMDKVYAELAPLCDEKHHIYFTSFDVRTIRYAKERYPDFERIVIDGNPLDKAFLDICSELEVKRIGAAIYGLSRTMVRKAHESGFKVNVWPGEKIDDSLLGVYLEADGLCSDIPVAVKEYLENSTDVKFVCD